MVTWLNRTPVFWVGASIVILAGLLILLSSFMAWMPRGLTGMNLVSTRVIGTSGGSFNAFFTASNGYIVFSGLWSVLLGVGLLATGIMLIGSIGYSMAYFASVLGFLALGLSVVNLVTLSALNFGVGAGAIVFLVFAIIGLAGTALVHADRAFARRRMVETEVVTTSEYVAPAVVTPMRPAAGYGTYGQAPGFRTPAAAQAPPAAQPMGRTIQRERYVEQQTQPSAQQPTGGLGPVPGSPPYTPSARS